MFFAENKKKIAIFTFFLMFISLLAGFTGAFMVLNTLEGSNLLSSQEAPEIKGQAMEKIIEFPEKNWQTGKKQTIPQIYNLVSHSVVEITTEVMELGGYMGQYISSGAGSGVIFSEDGYIITNNHVINKASKIMVRLKNGKKYEAKLIAKDEKTDIALIKIAETGLQAAFFADSDKIIVGELVVALGNPLGELGGTITEGIISASDREIIIDNETMVLLQTTAAINPGNSGGGLFNDRGELVGIVNAKTSGLNIEGLGFAIPSNLVSSVVKELLEFGYVKGRPALGVSIFEVQDARTAILYRVEKTGLYIASAKEGSPLLVGDRVLSFEGQNITRLSDLKKLIDSKKVGERVKIKVERNGSIKELEIKLMELS